MKKPELAPNIRAFTAQFNVVASCVSSSILAVTSVAERAKVLLFCAMGKDCELWHDVMDELFVGDASFERDFFMMTTWHTDETLDEVIEFARVLHIDHPDNETVQIIEV